MTVAELFIELGIKGTDKTGRELGKTKSSLNDIKSSSLAAKAAIMAVIYGIERLATGAAREGAGLVEFAEATGLSAQKLQQWQIATRDFGVGAEEVESSVRGIQNAMTDMLLGKGAPAGIEIIGQRVGLDQSKVRDTYYVLQKLQEFAKSNDEVDVNKRLLSSFGISDKMFQALRRARSDVDKIKGGISSDHQSRQLERVDAAWARLTRNVQLFVKEFTAMHGLQAVTALSNSYKVLMDLSGAMGKLMKEFPELALVAKVAAVAIALAFAPLTTIAVGLILLMDQIQKYRNGEESIFADKDHLDKRKGVADFMKDDKKSKGMFDAMSAAMGGKPNPTDDVLNRGATPNAPGGAKTDNKNININNNTTINTNTDNPRDHAKSVNDELYSSFAQMAAQGIVK